MRCHGGLNSGSKFKMGYHLAVLNVSVDFKNIGVVTESILLMILYLNCCTSAKTKDLTLFV